MASQKRLLLYRRALPPAPLEMWMRITFVQYGDFFEAAHRFDAGGDETYAAQRYSVDLVRELKSVFEDVCVICLSVSYSEKVLPDGVRTLGIRLYHDGDEASLTQLVTQQCPTHLVLRSPIVKLLRWSASRDVATLPLLATSFPRGNFRSWLRYRRIARALNASHICWVGNHSTNSANDLHRIGVDQARIIPWDWPPAARPGDWSAKRGLCSRGRIRIFYAGRVQETKGIGDCIRAIGVACRRGLAAQLTVAGTGDLERYRALAEELGLGDAVHFSGRIAHRDVVRLMHEHDVVVVPSQHAYPEGLPMTIYEAYASRTPLVASDHPMFQAKVRDRRISTCISCRGSYRVGGTSRAAGIGRGSLRRAFRGLCAGLGAAPATSKVGGTTPPLAAEFTRRSRLAGSAFPRERPLFPPSLLSRSLGSNAYEVQMNTGENNCSDRLI